MLAEEAEPELKGERQVAWLERFEAEHDNLRAAISCSLEERKFQDAARLGWALWLFWWIRGHFAEGRRSMEQALSAECNAAMPASARAQALYVAGTMACGQGDHRSAELASSKKAQPCSGNWGTGEEWRTRWEVLLSWRSPRRGMSKALFTLKRLRISSSRWGTNGVPRLCLGVRRWGGSTGEITGVRRAWRSEDWRCVERRATNTAPPSHSVPWRG